MILTKRLLPTILLFSCLFSFLHIFAQSAQKQKGLLWQVSGNGLKKPSYVYGTMHVSQKIAFHLGDSFYIALSKSDVVALEQDLDSVIHRWITESESDNPEDAGKVYPRSSFDFLTLNSFTLNSYNKKLIQRKLSAEVREVNYLLTRGDQDDFEEDAWLDLYIYQLAKKLKKGFTGVEGYEESRDLVKIAAKEPKDKSDKKKKQIRSNYRLRLQIADAYRRGDIYMLDSIDRMTESEHYLEYMLYKRNANMVRRMDSIMRTGKTMFTGVGCSHLPGTKGVLQMLQEKGYTLRPVQSIALEKSKLAKKYEDIPVKHKYTEQRSDDGLFSASLPARLTRVNTNSYYSSYLSPDMANGYYYQIEKIACNTVFSGKTPEDILMVVDTMIFENIPGEITDKRNIVSNGFQGIEVVTRLKTGDLNRFQILASPFNLYIIRMSGKKDFALSNVATNFFKTLKISEGIASGWKQISSPDSTFSLELPSTGTQNKLPMSDMANPSFEHLVYDRESGNTYLIKQEDILNEHYMEEDSFELNVMARSFAATDRYKTISERHFIWQGYHAKDVEFSTKSDHPILARFVLCGTKYLMFVLKPNGHGARFSDRYFNSIRFNGKPSDIYFEYYDTSGFFRVKTPVTPLLTKKNREYNAYGGMFGDEDTDTDSKYKGVFTSVYLKPQNCNEFVSISTYRYGYYESQNKNRDAYFKDWEKEGSLKLLYKKKETRKGIEYVTYTYSDTNTTRQFRAMHALRGKMRYYVEAFIDTVAGPSRFIETVFSSFDISDTLLEEDIFRKKGYRFFEDFSGKDSAARKAAIKNFTEVTFGKEDIPSMCHSIDSIDMKGDAAELRSAFIEKLSEIDSAGHIIVPYLQKLYARFADTAYMQIDILRALASQKTDQAFKAIKPILAQDVPISDNVYNMHNMLLFFSDSLKLAKHILPELIELTGINEYRKAAYFILSKMKDSGIISGTDYISIHDKLVRETKIEYKRMMASLTKSNKGRSGDLNYPNYDYNIQSKRINSTSYTVDYDPYSNTSEDVFTLMSDILDLSLPLLSKNQTIQDIAGKIIRITDNPCRLALMPVLLKYKVFFHDTVYKSLAKTNATRNRLYNILDEARQLNLFPSEYKSHRHWILSDLYSKEDDNSHIDTVIFLNRYTIFLGKDTGVVYACKVKADESDEWILYMSDALPVDTAKLNRYNTKPMFAADLTYLGSEDELGHTISEYLFENQLRYTRQRNGGYYYSRRSEASSYDGEY